MIEDSPALRQIFFFRLSNRYQWHKACFFRRRPTDWFSDWRTGDWLSCALRDRLASPRCRPVPPAFRGGFRPLSRYHRVAPAPPPLAGPHVPSLPEEPRPAGIAPGDQPGATLPFPEPRRRTACQPPICLQGRMPRLPGRQAPHLFPRDEDYGIAILKVGRSSADAIRRCPDPGFPQGRPHLRGTTTGGGLRLISTSPPDYDEALLQW